MRASLRPEVKSQSQRYPCRTASPQKLPRRLGSSPIKTAATPGAATVVHFSAESTALRPDARMGKCPLVHTEWVCTKLPALPSTGRATSSTAIAMQPIAAWLHHSST